MIGFGVWMGTRHDQCHRTLTVPVMCLGAVILVISLVGFVGALKNIIFLLWVYLVLLLLILVAILAFTVLAFIITNNGSGHAVSGIRFKEYHLQDYSIWFLKEINNTKNWARLKSCFLMSEDCNNLPKMYKTLKAFKSAELTPIEAGCCRPPSEAGVAQYMKSEWRIVAVLNLILFVILAAVYFVACCARRNAYTENLSKEGRG